MSCVSCARPAPPHSERAERVLLAGLIREPQLVAEACVHHGVAESDLYFHTHRLVWRAAWDVIESGLVPDLVGVWQVLLCEGTAADLGPRPALWLAELWEADPTGAWCDWACGVIRYEADRRNRIHAAREVLRGEGMQV